MTTPIGYTEGWRSEFPESLVGIQEIFKDKREDGTQSGMRAVDGYYDLNGKLVRQINVYDVKTDEAATEGARKDGLVRGIMLEVFLGEPQPCVLLNSVRRDK